MWAPLLLRRGTVAESRSGIPIASRVRWGWILAVALGWLLGLIAAAAVGVTGARLGAPDAFDRDGYAPSEDVRTAPGDPGKAERAVTPTRD